MSSSTVDAVVLRRWDSSESDRRVSLLTRERGKVVAVARGARKARSKLAGITEPLTRSSLELASGRHTDYIIQAQPTRSFGGLRTDYARLCTSLVWLETLDAALHTGEPHEDAFDLCLLVLEAIECSKEALAPLAWGDLRLMELIGHAPEFGVSVQTGEPIPPGRAVLCPRAGGAVGFGEVEEGWPALSVSGQTIAALRGLQELEAPPTFLRSAVEVSKAILPFWIEFLEGELPARRNLLGG